MQGKVVKIFSDFYYVKTNWGLVECKLREILKKSGVQIIVGDNVIIEDFREISNQAAITELLPRKNSILRPSVANIDEIVLVVSLKHPRTPLNSIDRYLAQAQFFGIDVIICVNKSDLTSLQERIEFEKFYGALGYKIVFTSAIKKTGIGELKNIIKEKTSLLCGASGVGKTSLCNAINPNFVLRVGKISKNSRGTHTTRHCEILSFDSNSVSFNLVDTPGFSLLKFDYVEPKKIEEFFPEIKMFAKECKFTNCLHECEVGCNVIANIEKIFPSRYESYLSILQEAKNYKKKIKEQGTKVETKTKKLNSKAVPKISAKKRNYSRKKAKQILNVNIKEDF